MAVELKLPAKQMRQNLLDEGLQFLVSATKAEAYQDRPTKRTVVSEAQRRYLNGFVDEKGEVIGDVIDTSYETLAGEDIGISGETIEKSRLAQLQWIQIAYNFLTTEQGQAVFSQFLTETDKQKLELPEFLADRRPLTTNQGGFGYMNPGVLVRIDELLSEDGRILACDPNLIPLGFAFARGYCDQARRLGVRGLNNMDGYPSRLGGMTLNNGNRLSGIVTTLNYPNWPSHAYTAAVVRELTGAPFYVIPLEAVNHGTGRIDSDQVADFYQTLGLKGAGTVKREGEVVPSVVVRYARESGRVSPDTYAVNNPGFRVLESQLWNGLATLDGFEALYQRVTGQTYSQTLHRETNIPSLIGRVNGQGIDIATSINLDGQVNWKNINEALHLLQALQESIQTTDKPSEWTWFVKTFSTSGKKGVRFTTGGKLDKAERNILKPAQVLAPDGTFLIQPKIRSTVMLEDENRLKIDLFLSGEDLDLCGVDAMTTPIHQRSSHGGSSTRMVMVAL